MEGNDALFRGILDNFETRKAVHPLATGHKGFPPSSWEGWEGMAEDLGIEGVDSGSRARHATKIAIQADVDNLNGENVDWDLVESHLVEILVGDSEANPIPNTQTDIETSLQPKIIAGERKKRGRRTEINYLVSFPADAADEVSNDWFSRGELKKRFPDTWKSMLDAWATFQATKQGTAVSTEEEEEEAVVKDAHPHGRVTAFRNINDMPDEDEASWREMINTVNVMHMLSAGEHPQTSAIQGAVNYSLFQPAFATGAAPAVDLPRNGTTVTGGGSVISPPPLGQPHVVVAPQQQELQRQQQELQRQQQERLQQQQELQRQHKEQERLQRQQRRLQQQEQQHKEQEQQQEEEQEQREQRRQRQEYCFSLLREYPYVLKSPPPLSASQDEWESFEALLEEKKRERDEYYQQCRQKTYYMEYIQQQQHLEQQQQRYLQQQQEQQQQQDEPYRPPPLPVHSNLYMPHVAYISNNFNAVRYGKNKRRREEKDNILSLQKLLSLSKSIPTLDSLHTITTTTNNNANNKRAATVNHIATTAADDDQGKRVLHQMPLRGGIHKKKQYRLHPLAKRNVEFAKESGEYIPRKVLECLVVGDVNINREERRKESPKKKTEKKKMRKKEERQVQQEKNPVVDTSTAANDENNDDDDERRMMNVEETPLHSDGRRRSSRNIPPSSKERSLKRKRRMRGLYDQNKRKAMISPNILPEDHVVMNGNRDTIAAATPKEMGHNDDNDVKIKKEKKKSVVAGHGVNENRLQPLAPPSAEKKVAAGQSRVRRRKQQPSSLPTSQRRKQQLSPLPTYQRTRAETKMQNGQTQRTTMKKYEEEEDDEMVELPATVAKKRSMVTPNNNNVNENRRVKEEVDDDKNNIRKTRRQMQELERRLQKDEWKGVVITGAGKGANSSVNLWLTWSDGYREIVSSEQLLGKMHCMSTLIEFYESKSTAKKKAKDRVG